jgi:large subunit ribosomal protein L24
MKKDFSTAWKSSSQKRKQIKYRANAPLHIKHKLMASHLSADLRKKHGKRTVGIRKDDKVKIMRGQFKGLTGKVERVNTKREYIYVRGAEMTKKDGTKSFYPLHPSNLMILELNLSDKKRVEAIGRAKKNNMGKKE